MGNYRNDAPHLTVAALVRDGADDLKSAPGGRNVGLGARREQAIDEVLAGLLSVEIDSEGER